MSARTTVDRSPVPGPSMICVSGAQVFVLVTLEAGLPTIRIRLEEAVCVADACSRIFLFFFLLLSPMSCVKKRVRQAPMEIGSAVSPIMKFFVTHLRY